MNSETAIDINNTVNDNLFIKLIRAVAFTFVLAWVLLPIVMLYFYYFDQMFWAVAGYNILAGYIGVFNLGVAIVYFVTQLLRRQVSVLHNILEKPWNFTLLLLLIWCFITAWLQDDYANAFLGNENSMDGLMLVLICAGIYGSTLIIGNLKCVKWLYVAMITASTATCIAMVQQYLCPDNSITLIDPMFATYDNLSTIFYNSNIFGYYLVMAVMVLIGMLLLSRRIIPQLCLLVLLLGHGWVVLQQGAFGPILTTAIACLIVPVYLIRAGRLKIFKYFLVLAVLLSVAAGVCVIYSDTIFGNDRAIKDMLIFKSDIATVLENPDSQDALDSGTGRWVLWKESLAMIKDSPLYGYGPVEFQVAIRERLSKTLGVAIDEERKLFFWPHNEIMQYAAFYGIIGCLLYIFTLVSIFIYQWKHLKKVSNNALIAACVVTGYFISSMFGILACYTVPFFYMFLALATCYGSQPGALCSERTERHQPKHAG